MSIQAVAWVLEQKLPMGPKLVLVALANHADHRTGHCYPGMQRIADEASCSVRAVYNYISALAHNGFILVQRGPRGKDGKQRSNNYWLMFDREQADWIPLKEAAEAAAKAAGDDAENIAPDDEAEPSARDADGEIEQGADGPIEQDSPGPSAPGFRPHISLEPSGLEPSSPLPPKGVAATPHGIRGVIPNSFTPKSRTEQIASDMAAKAEADRQPKRVFVFEGSKAWDAWIEYKRQRRMPGATTPATCWGVGENAKRRGWYFPSLFPPDDAPEARAGPQHQSA